VARKLAHLPNLLFLDSADRSTERGRYSYVAADPIALISMRADLFTPSEPIDAFMGDIAWPTGKYDSIGLMAEQITHAKLEAERWIPPFQGGLAGLFGYGFCHEVEQIPDPHVDEFGLPIAEVGVFDWVVSFDHKLGKAWIVSTGHSCERLPPSKRIQKAETRLGNVKKDLTEKGNTPHAANSISDASPAYQHDVSRYPDVTSNFSRDQYLAAVQKTIDYVHAGDCFQVNLSQRLLAPLREHPLELYGRLRQRNPAPYGCYFDLGDFQILSASPEQFLKVSNGEVVTRPIKGTRPRGKTPVEDARIVRELQANPKDRAENVMIVDLLRNDLGRVCEYGSIHVPKVCEVETFAHVHHLVSEVRGKLRPDKTPFDLLRASFPGGSVTGAPKVRAMEIIAELEPTARGPYCGSIGFVGFDGSMDSNILIRTFTAGRGWVQFPVGGGIVADSNPETEYEETLHKAKGLLDALEP
jgi:para-aminobenzoate synthetase component 1